MVASDLNRPSNKENEGCSSPASLISMRILGVDPGVSTGIVVWDTVEDEIVYHTTIADDKYCIQWISKVYLWFFCDVLVLEKAPLHGDPLQYQRVMSIHTELMEIAKIVEILPSQWKPIAKAQRWSIRNLSIRHEKDAFHMAIYAYKFCNIREK